MGTFHFFSVFVQTLATRGHGAAAGPNSYPTSAIPLFPSTRHRPSPALLLRWFSAPAQTPGPPTPAFPQILELVLENHQTDSRTTLHRHSRPSSNRHENHLNRHSSPPSKLENHQADAPLPPLLFSLFPKGLALPRSAPALAQQRGCVSPDFPQAPLHEKSRS